MSGQGSPQQTWHPARGLEISPYSANTLNPSMA